MTTKAPMPRERQPYQAPRSFPVDYVPVHHRPMQTTGPSSGEVLLACLILAIVAIGGLMLATIH